MIQQLHLRHFKCFTDQSVRFGPLTLLVGANASGKSSVIQALLLLRQSHRAGTMAARKLLLRGDLVNVGTQGEVIARVRSDDQLMFTLTDDRGEHPFCFTFDINHAKAYVMDGAPHHNEMNGALFQPAFNYLNAERIGPRLLYPIGGDENWDYDVGIQGQHVAAILGRFRDAPIANALTATTTDTVLPQVLTPDPDAPIDLSDEAARSHPETNLLPSYPFRPLAAEVTAWMHMIIPGFTFRADIIDQTDQATLLLGTDSTQPLVRPTNIGFGLIYTLPIVVAALVAPPGSLLIVENPEAHLHPRSQSIMGRFLAQVAASGVQVIVETHSDHILNGVRVAVRQNMLAARDVSIQFFMGADHDGPQRVETPRLYPSGGIRPWPKGFFDQYESDLRNLI